MHVELDAMMKEIDRKARSSTADSHDTGSEDTEGYYGQSESEVKEVEGVQLSSVSQASEGVPPDLLASAMEDLDTTPAAGSEGPEVPELRLEGQTSDEQSAPDLTVAGAGEEEGAVGGEVGESEREDTEFEEEWDPEIAYNKDYDVSGVENDKIIDSKIPMKCCEEWSDQDDDLDEEQ